MSSAASWDVETWGERAPRLSHGHLDLRLGSELGPYRLIRELGTGGMATLYVGEHQTLGRKMAIKVLHPSLARRADIVRRFFAEARSVTAINHEHIVEIFDVVASSAGLNYLVMELLEGNDLQQSRVVDGPHPLAQTLGIVAQTASALGAAHAKGIVHRDIKPENVFLIQRPGHTHFVKLLDFGLAKLSDALQGNAEHTQAGAVLGTPEYMSPEQARGAAVDARSDVYALGLLFHWLLTDRLPHPSRDVDELREQRARGTPPLPACTVFGDPIPAVVDALVRRCLRPTPADRFQSMGDVEAALCAGQPNRALPPSTTAR